VRIEESRISYHERQTHTTVFSIDHLRKDDLRTAHHSASKWGKGREKRGFDMQLPIRFSDVNIQSSRAPGICKEIEGVSYYGCVAIIHLSVSDAWACGNNVCLKHL